MLVIALLLLLGMRDKAPPTEIHSAEGPSPLQGDLHLEARPWFAESEVLALVASLNQDTGSIRAKRYALNSGPSFILYKLGDFG